MRRILTTAVAIAAVAFPAATAASSSVAPSLSVVQRAPLQVRGLHFKRRERVVVTASSTQSQKTSISVRTNRLGRFLVSFGAFAPNSCTTVTITAKGARGDQAKLVLAPPPGTEIPCRE